MHFDEFRTILQPHLDYELDPGSEQGRVIMHGENPMQVIAGPGSGKTETAVLRVLVLMFVMEINPKSIIMTTFTEKAAKNMRDRILTYAGFLFDQYPDLRHQINIYDLRIGTLHSLCADIMQEYRYTGYQNFRLMDEMEQYLFIMQHSDFVQDPDRYSPIFEQFDYLFLGYDPLSGVRGWRDHRYPPNQWQRTRAAMLLFNRITEGVIDKDRMKRAGPAWDLLTEAYDQYHQQMTLHQRCDFPTIQQIFLEFLNSQVGRRFIEGDSSEPEIHPGVAHVIVDEYQDTNPIQEVIYFTLAHNTRNLCVVGDDDQALYRFRGGTVECMVTFDHACQHYLGVRSTPRYLGVNYRSHPTIVNYCDEYIRSFPVMRIEGARVEGKPQLSAGSSITGTYPAVAFIRGRTIEDTAQNFARCIRYLLDNHIIENANQCVLLMRSVKESPRNAGHFADALRDQGILPYNPRSRQFLEQEEITVALGAFVSIIDRNLQGIGGVRGQHVRDNIGRKVEEWIRAYDRVAATSPALRDYVDEARQAIQTKTQEIFQRRDRKTKIGVSIGDVYYHILAHEPFGGWQEDPERTYRLGQLSVIFEQYASIPYLDSPGSYRGDLRASRDRPAISFGWLKDFYNHLVGRLIASGMNDPEEEDIIAPPNRLPIMTVHQAKGLEFDFVFVYGLNRDVEVEEAIHLEDNFEPFRQTQSYIHMIQDQRAAQDIVRFYYVAYSRAKWALIQLVPDAHLRKRPPGFGIIGRNLQRFRMTHQL